MRMPRCSTATGTLRGRRWSRRQKLTVSRTRANSTRPGSTDASPMSLISRGLTWPMAPAHSHRQNTAINAHSAGPGRLERRQQRQRRRPRRAAAGRGGCRRAHAVLSAQAGSPHADGEGGGLDRGHGLGLCVGAQAAQGAQAGTAPTDLSPTASRPRSTPCPPDPPEPRRNRGRTHRDDAAHRSGDDRLGELAGRTARGEVHLHERERDERDEQDAQGGGTGGPRSERRAARGAGPRGGRWMRRTPLRRVTTFRPPTGPPGPATRVGAMPRRRGPCPSRSG